MARGPPVARKFIAPRLANAYSGLLIPLNANEISAFPADIRSNQQNAVYL